MIEIIETPKQHVVLDSQILSTLMSCPRLTDFRFHHNLVPNGGKSNSLEVGSMVHHILEHFNKSLINGLTRNDAIDKGFEAGMLYVRNGDDGEGSNIPEENTKYKNGHIDNIGWKYVIQTMIEYFDFWKNDSYTVIAAEEVRGVVIYEDDELRILWKAKFDEIDDMPNGFIPKDHKTMRMNRDALSLNNQFMGQCVLLKSRNMIINKIGFQSSLEPKEKFIRAIISYTKDRLDEWCNDIVPHYARMYLAYSEVEYFPPNFTHCENKYGVCNFKEVCESNKNMREEVLRVNFHKTEKWDVTNPE